MSGHLFVYGTLRRGQDNRYARLLEESARFAGTATVRGSLYRIAHYPGWVESGEGRVTGELFEFDAESAILAILDEYEGAEYERVETEALREDGTMTRAWIYRYRASLAGKQRIESGDWLTAPE